MHEVALGAWRVHLYMVLMLMRRAVCFRPLGWGFKWEGTVAQEGDAPGSPLRLARAGAASAAAGHRLEQMATADAARRRAAAKASMALATAKDVAASRARWRACRRCS